MLQYFETLQDESGNALSLDGTATVIVTNYPSGSLASIYSSNGTASPIAGSTVTADVTGQVSFFVPDGAYTLTYKLNAATYKTKSPVQMLDPMGLAVITDTGAANAYVVTSSAYPASLYAGLKIQVKIGAGNTNTLTTVTLNLNSTGNQPVLQPGGGSMAAGAMAAGGIYNLEWDGTEWQLLSSTLSSSSIGGLLYPVTAAETAAGVVPVNLTYPSPGIESGDVLRYSGAVAPAAMHDVVFFDATQTQIVIGNRPYTPTNLWFANGTAASRLQEFACAFQYVASGGGAFNNDADFGVALVAAAKITGGARAIFTMNAIAEVDITGTTPSFGRQATVIAFEADVNNNSSADVALTTNAYDQIVGIRSASGGNYKAQVGFQTVSPSFLNRWRVGAGIANWNDYGMAIVQDPGTVTTDASGTNTGTTGAAATVTAGSAPIVVANNFVAGNQVAFTGSFASVTGLVAGTIYYVIAAGLSASQFEVSATLGGGAITPGGSGSATPSVAQVVTGPAIILQASSNGGLNPIFRVLGLNALPNFDILQSGAVRLANNVTLDWFDSGGTPQTTMFVSASNNLYVTTSPTGPGNGYLSDDGLVVKVAWNRTGLAFFGASPVAQITGYGTPTGGSHQASFAAGAITLPNLAAAVAQLIIDLKSYGVLGA